MGRDSTSLAFPSTVDFSAGLLLPVANVYSWRLYIALEVVFYDQVLHYFLNWIPRNERKE